MTRPAGIAITAEQRRIVLQILHAHLPPDSNAWVFGSRAAWQAVGDEFRRLIAPERRALADVPDLRRD